MLCSSKPRSLERAAVDSMCCRLTLVEGGHLVLRFSDGTRCGRTCCHRRRAERTTGVFDVARLEEFEDSCVYLRGNRDRGEDVLGLTCDHRRRRQFPPGTGPFSSSSQGGARLNLVIRGANFVKIMSSYLIDRIVEDGNITVESESRITALEGDESLAALELTGPTGVERVACSALFSFIGADPASGWLSVGS